MSTHRNRGRNQRNHIDAETSHNPRRTWRDAFQQFHISLQCPSLGREAERECRGKHKTIDGSWRALMLPMKHRPVSHEPWLIAGVGGMKLMLLRLLHLVFDEARRVGINRTIVVVARCSGSIAP